MIGNVASVMYLHLCKAFLILLTTVSTFNYKSHFKHASMPYHYVTLWRFPPWSFKDQQVSVSLD